MDGEAILTVSAAVVALTQLLKWAGVSHEWGPLLVLALAAIGTALWVWTQNIIDIRPLAFDFFAGWIAVATSAAGVFGFTRAGSEAITSLRNR